MNLHWELFPSSSFQSLLLCPLFVPPFLFPSFRTPLPLFAPSSSSSWPISLLCPALRFRTLSLAIVLLRARLFSLPIIAVRALFFPSSHFLLSQAHQPVLPPLPPLPALHPRQFSPVRRLRLRLRLRFHPRPPQSLRTRILKRTRWPFPASHLRTITRIPLSLHPPKRAAVIMRHNRPNRQQLKAIWICRPC